MKTSLVIESKIAKLEKKNEEKTKILNHFNEILETKDKNSFEFPHMRRERQELISKIADVRVKILEYRGILQELSSHYDVSLKAV